jgi:hypothetical protein
MWNALTPYIEQPALNGGASDASPRFQARNKSPRNIIILAPQHCYGRGEATHKQAASLARE